MRNMHRHLRRGLPVAGACLLLALVASPAQAVDWNGVTGRTVTLFYPGQASWEWALTQSDHSGAKKFRGGKNCASCHRGEERKIGALIVSGKKLEPKPIPGKRGSVSLNVKTAHDGQRLYVRLEWSAGRAPRGPKMDPKYEAKVTLILDDGRVIEARRAGCWGACHDDAVGMASAPPGSKITKYLTRSRTKITRKGGGVSYKPRGALDGLRRAGIFLEYWQARLNRGAKPVAADGLILEKRTKNSTPAVRAEGGFQGGRWVVVLSRKLRMGDPLHKDIVPGKVYSIGFALHSAYAEHRFHQISFEHTLVLDKGKASFVAVKR